jgi:hypothetical protein
VVSPVVASGWGNFYAERRDAQAEQRPACRIAIRERAVPATILSQLGDVHLNKGRRLDAGALTETDLKQGKGRP